MLLKHRFNNRKYLSAVLRQKETLKPTGLLQLKMLCKTCVVSSSALRFILLFFPQNVTTCIWSSLFATGPHAAQGLLRLLTHADVGGHSAGYAAWLKTVRCLPALVTGC